MKNKTEVIKKGEGEYKYCQRCRRRFRRKKSFWNFFHTFLFCPKCRRSFNEWWDNCDYAK